MTIPIVVCNDPVIFGLPRLALGYLGALGDLDRNARSFHRSIHSIRSARHKFL